MTAPDLDALIERLEKDAIAWGLVFDSTVSASTTAALEREAAAALAELRDRIAELERERDAARALLREWRETEYFDDSQAWQEWVDKFGPRIDAAIDAARERANG